MATSSDISKYDITKLSYPENLHSSNSEFGGNKVVFFINVSADSNKVNVGDKGTQNYAGDAMFDIPEADRIKSSGNNMQAGVKSAVGAINTGIKKTNDKLGSDIPPMSITIGQMKRLSTAIALYMPNSITQGTGVSWSEEDMHAGVVAAVDIVQKLATEGKEAAAKAGVNALAAHVLKDSNTFQRATRMTPGNSKQEMLFKGVDYRTMSFNYTFAPKSEKEAKRVMEIIRTFKYHMLPEYKGADEFLYIYPSEFQIKYFKGSVENEFIEKQLTAVLLRVNIDYTPNGQFTTFANGMPQQINMSLEFKEIGTVSKELASFRYSADNFVQGI